MSRAPKRMDVHFSLQVRRPALSCVQGWAFPVPSLSLPLEGVGPPFPWMRMSRIQPSRGAEGAREPYCFQYSSSVYCTEYRP